jgi:hypothetical protein
MDVGFPQSLSTRTPQSWETATYSCKAASPHSRNPFVKLDETLTSKLDNKLANLHASLIAN